MFVVCYLMYSRYALALSLHLEFQLLYMHIINKNRIIIIIAMVLPCFSHFVFCMYVWCSQLAIRPLCRQAITEGLN